PKTKMFFQVFFHKSVRNSFATKRKCASGSGNTVWNRIFRLFPDSVVIQECSDIQQVSKVYFVVFAEILCEQIRISDIAPDYFRPNVIIDEVCARYIQCGLVIICAYKEKRMVFEHFSAQRMPLDGFKDVLYESS